MSSKRTGSLSQYSSTRRSRPCYWSYGLTGNASKNKENGLGCQHISIWRRNKHLAHIGEQGYTGTQIITITKAVITRSKVDGFSKTQEFLKLQNIINISCLAKHLLEHHFKSVKSDDVTPYIIARISKTRGVLETLRLYHELHFSKVFANTPISRCKLRFKTRQIKNWKLETQLHWMLQSTACSSSVTQTCSLPTTFEFQISKTGLELAKQGLLAGQQPSQLSI